MVTQENGEHNTRKCSIILRVRQRRIVTYILIDRGLLKMDLKFFNKNINEYSEFLELLIRCGNKIL